MSVSIVHPTSTEAITVENNRFFPNIVLGTVRADYGINDRTDDAELTRITKSNLIRVNSDLSQWVKQKIALGYETLAEVPPDDSSAVLGDESIHEINYLQAVCYGIKADVIRAKLDYDLTAKGDQEAEEREDKAMHYTAESTRALRSLLGRGHIRVRRIKTKNNNNSPLDNLLRFGHDNGK